MDLKLKELLEHILTLSEKDMRTEIQAIITDFPRHAANLLSFGECSLDEIKEIRESIIEGAPITAFWECDEGIFAIDVVGWSPGQIAECGLAMMDDTEAFASISIGQDPRVWFYPCGNSDCCGFDSLMRSNESWLGCDVGLRAWINHATKGEYLDEVNSLTKEQLLAFAAQNELILPVEE